MSPSSLSDRCSRHMRSLSVHTLPTQNAKSSRSVRHDLSPPLTHVETRCIFQLTGRSVCSFLSASAGKSDCSGAGEESELDVSIAFKAVESFKYSNSDMRHLCKLAWHSEIVPVINNFELWMMKSTGLLEGHRPKVLVFTVPSVRIRGGFSGSRDPEQCDLVFLQFFFFLFFFTLLPWSHWNPRCCTTFTSCQCPCRHDAWILPGKFPFCDHCV